MILLSTESLEWYWLHRIFLFAKEAWFYGVDLSISFDNFDTLDVDYIKKISDEIWIKVLSISAPSQKVKKTSNLSIAVKNVSPEFLFFIIPARKNASLMEIKKITGDTSFDLANSVDIMKDSSFLWNSIKNVYLSDSIWDKKWLLLWTSVWTTSNLPIESLLMKLKASSYNWLFSLKLNPKELWAWNEDKVLNNLKSCIEYYEKYFSDK